MNTFRDLINSDFANTFFDPNKFAESGRVAYTPKNGTAVSLVAIVGQENLKDEVTDAGLVAIGRRKVTICTDPDNADFNGVADPQLNGSVSVDGIDYAVDEIGTVTPKFADLMLKRTVVRELSRSNYRK